MAAKNTKRGRGRPRGDLRHWFTKRLPSIKAVKAGGEKEVSVDHPQHGELTISIPRGYVPIPPELTDGKSAANVGQTARNEAKALKLKKKFTVHEMTFEVAGARKNKEATVFALEGK